MHTHELYKGETINDAEKDTIKNFSLFNEQGLLQLPTFIKAGAIIPKFDAPEPRNGRIDFTDSLMVVQIYIAHEISTDETFMIFEDDGETMNYTDGTYSQIEVKNQYDASQKRATVSFNVVKSDFVDMKGVAKLRIITSKPVSQISSQGVQMDVEKISPRVFEMDMKVDSSNSVFEIQLE
jgi:alpha-glucosidase (family GH31 glycosyl hydrolase)